VNLGQTDFSIPRWFTEGLAVDNEGPGRPRLWGQILARRVAADRLFNLDTITLGFIRPSSGEDWALAYYQAEIYVRYMTATYGKDAPRKLIAAYGDHLDTRAALERSFGATQEKFEQGYLAYVKSIVATGPGIAAAPPSQDLPTLERQAKANPRDAHAFALLAQSHLKTGRTNEARDWGNKALALDPKEQLAAFVVAQASVSTGDRAHAIELLRGALNPDDPQVDALMLLTNLMLESKDYAQTQRLASLGDQRFPLEANWLAGLAVAYRESGQRDKLAEVLARRAEGDSDDLSIRLELARLDQDRNDFESAERWALDAIHIDVMNAEAHAILARAEGQRGRNEAAIEEYGTALTLDPEKPEWRLAEAKACVAVGRKAQARELLTAALKRDPHDAGARQLLDTLGR
jgi:tetratricopeptide (TPR) repeat protein